MQQNDPCVLRLSVSSDQKDQIMVGTGSAVSPIIFCLSAQGLGITDPTIMPPLTV